MRSHPACTSERWVTKDIITHSLPLLVYGLIRSPTESDLVKDAAPSWAQTADPGLAARLAAVRRGLMSVL